MENFIQGLSISAIGIVIVMCVLALLSVILSLLKFAGRDKHTPPIQEQTPPLLSVVPEQTADIPSPEEMGIPGDVIAAITAAVHASLEGQLSPKQAVRIASVRQASAWKQSGRREQQTRIY